MTDLRLNPALQPDGYAAIYARDGVVQVPGLLEPEAAEAVAAVLERGVDWDLVHSGPDGREQLLSRAEIAALGKEALGARLQATVRQAQDGFAYLYLAYPMVTAYLNGRDPGHPLHGVLDFLNSPALLDFARAVTGERAVVKADAQATLYRPGDFLTLHDDTGVGDRRAAYTLGFTRRWRPDWGGQLLFHDDAGEITRGLTPGFNVLTLFRTPQQHSVAAVAAYAGAPRLSITGWLREAPVSAR